MQRKRVAIVGSGCSGLGALWLLKKTDHEIHLYEAGDRLGGHTNTVTFTNGENSTKVDSGFIVMNSATYPNFIAFLKELGVVTVATEMTFGVSRDQGLFEWAGSSLGAVFAQRSNLFRPSMWRMIFDILRFNQFALDLLLNEDDMEHDQTNINGDAKHPPPRRQETIGEYLDRQGYSDRFRDDYLIPMTAAVWSTSPDKCSLEFPAVTLARFMWNHHLLTAISERPKWLTIQGGAQRYIDAVLDDFPSQNVHLSTPIKFVHDAPDSQVILETSTGKQMFFDHVILATHGDQALEIIWPSATQEEKDILGNFHTSQNVAVLHSDLKLMPRREVAWSAWNYITQTSGDSSNVNQVCLTYWMNLLQHIPTNSFGPVLVTLNPLVEPDPALTQGRWEYAHPLYTPSAVRAQTRLPSIQNTRGISYAGAWTKYGFHEDGFSSGLSAAIGHLGAKMPFEFVDSTFSRGKKPVLGPGDYVARAVLVVIQFCIAILSGVYAGVQAVAGVRKRIKVQ
ncbi:MAG: hypothetical protein M1832_000426 [Thelocarpon impressellum]|nr:MAG: hypothetical protein M1832_000426 [Thelocarpon impressellum]